MASLPPVVDKLEDIAEPARAFYEQREGKFVLSLSGTPLGFSPSADLAAANAKVVEFRDNNIRLSKENADLIPLRDKFKDLDPDAARAAIAAQTELSKRGIKGADDVQTLVSSAVAAALKPVQDQLLALNTTNAETERRNADLILRTAIGEQFTRSGGEPTALDFIVDRAKKVFGVEGGQVQAGNVFSSDRPGERITVAEWIGTQMKEAAFAFKPSGGGGANPAQGAGASAANRPNVVVLRDPTPQQLGTYGADIRAGKMRVEYSQ